MAKQRKLTTIVLLVTGILAVVVVGIIAWDELVAWRTFWRDFEGLGKNAQGRPEYRHLETGIVFVALPRGTFDMGSPETESGRGGNEGPVHKVRLSPFLIAKYEVSQAEWKKVMGDNPSAFKDDTLPVEQVSWDDCQEFCTKTGLSLPTEAQWEYACRAGTSGPFAGTGNLDDMGWHRKNSGGRRTHPVGEKKPNQFGLHDMHGNVSEWCEDWYQWDYYCEGSVVEPLCHNTVSGGRVVRGGGMCRSASRDGAPGFRGSLEFRLRDHLGFRPAWSSP